MSEFLTLGGTPVMVQMVLGVLVLASWIALVWLARRVGRRWTLAMLGITGAAPWLVGVAFYWRAMRVVREISAAVNSPLLSAYQKAAHDEAVLVFYIPAVLTVGLVIAFLLTLFRTAR